MKNLYTLIAILLTAALFLFACAEKTSDTDGADATEGAKTTSAAEDTGQTESAGPDPEPTEPDDPDDVTDFFEENFGFDGDDGYEYKDSVGGKPVTDYGVYEEDGDGESYTPDDPDAPDKHDPLPTPLPAPEPDPDPAPEPEPTPDPDPAPEPVAPKDSYAGAIAAIDDYTADVKLVCEVELSGGSVDRYVYTYRVSKAGEDYTATYTEKGAEKSTVFSAAEGTMTTDGNSKSAALSDFYRFCSMVEPLPLSLYYYEHSEAGTDFTARLKGEDYRALLLNTSALFTGFDTMQNLEMGSLYYSGHTDAEGVYTASKLKFDMELDDNILGRMLFRVSVEVNYAY